MTSMIRWALARMFLNIVLISDPVQSTIGAELLNHANLLPLKELKQVANKCSCPSL